MKLKYMLYLLSFILTSCSTGDKTASLFLYKESDPYMKILGDQIKSEAMESFSVLTFDSQNSQIIQNEFIEAQIGKSDVMIVNPVDRLGAYSIIKKLKSKDIPVIFFNREPLKEDLELWDQAYYVGAKAEQSGQIQAQMIMELFGNEGSSLNKFDKNGNNVIETVILKGEQGHQDAEIRTSEVVKTFGDNGFSLEILITEVANWNREEAYEKMKLILGQYSDNIELVISNNDAMALGAVSIMRQSGFFKDNNADGRIGKDDESWIPIVGIDGLDEAVKLINQGYLYGSVLNDSLSQSKAIVELTDFLINGKDFNLMNSVLVQEQYIWIDYKILK